MEGGASTPYHFGQAQRDGVLSMEIAYVQEPGDPVAVVSLFDTDERSAFAHGEVIVASAPESSTIERRAFDHLCKRAFFECGYRRLYVRTLAYFPPTFDDRRNAVVEGRFPDYLLTADGPAEMIVTTLRVGPQPVDKATSSRAGLVELRRLLAADRSGSVSRSFGRLPWSAVVRRVFACRSVSPNPVP